MSITVIGGDADRERVRQLASRLAEGRRVYVVRKPILASILLLISWTGPVVEEFVAPQGGGALAQAYWVRFLALASVPVLSCVLFALSVRRRECFRGIRLAGLLVCFVVFIFSLGGFSSLLVSFGVLGVFTNLSLIAAFIGPETMSVRALILTQLLLASIVCVFLAGFGMLGLLIGLPGLVLMLILILATSVSLAIKKNPSQLDQAATWLGFGYVLLIAVLILAVKLFQ